MRPDNEKDTIQALNSFPRRIGTITGTVATDNRTTATPFYIPSGATIMLQPDTACTVTDVAVADHAVANGITLQANEKFGPFFVNNTADNVTNRISMTPIAGTTNLKVLMVNVP